MDKVVLVIRYRGFNPHERITELAWVLTPNAAEARRTQFLIDPEIHVFSAKIYKLVEEV